FLSPWIRGVPAGQVSMDIAGSGAWLAPDITIRADAALMYEDMPVTLALQARSADGIEHIDSLDIQAGAADISISRRLDRHGDSGLLTATGRGIGVDILRRAGVNVPRDLNGRMDVDISARGALADPEADIAARFAGTYTQTPVSAVVRASGTHQDFRVENLLL